MGTRRACGAFVDTNDKKPLGTLRHDLPSGLVVFLVALPLCLGIAHASGVPPLAGIVTGVVGGLLVAWLSGSHTAVSGPAAGLIVIVLAAVDEFGYAGLVLATFLAGLMQLGFGLARFGGLARLFPSSVIKGMLVAIGVILVLKQIPHALGWGTFEGDEAFVQADGLNTFTEIPFALGHLHLGALVLSAVGLALIIATDKIEALRSRAWLPGPLLAVAAGVGLNELFSAFVPTLAVGGSLLTDVPVGSPTAFVGDLVGPAWSLIGEPRLWMSAATIAIIASIETLLCVEALDGFDPRGRKTPLNRELLAQGAGNVVSGLVGGIPMTAVIVRGSANIQAGARTRKSSFFHGALLLTAIAAVPEVINRIPLASLAAVLLVVGYRLARPRIFLEMFQRRYAHWVPFAATVAAVVFTDLLTGVLLGFALAVALVAAESVLAHRRRDESDVHLQIGPVVPYLSRAVLARVLARAREGMHVVIDGSDADLVDDELREAIDEVERSAASRRIRVEVRLPPTPAAAGH